MWIVIHFFCVAMLLFFVTTAWAGYTTNPLVTTLHDTIYPVANVPFPAVSICNNNRISRRAAVLLAKELSLKDDEFKRNETFFLDQIKFIGRLYDYETENIHLLTAFQQFLDLLNENGNTTKVNKTMEYEVLDLLDRLTPKCEDMLLRCFFKSIEIPCLMKYAMMETRRTQYGFCCTFNYIRMNDLDKSNHPYYSAVTGPDMGLILLVNGSSDDYFYSPFNSMGFIVQIHNPNEYPDSTSGSVVERFVRLGTETFLRVDGVTITSERDILRYSADKRQCVFADELPKYNGRYTRSECVVNCKIRSVKALCDCVPFNLPPPNIYTDPPVICSLQHVNCLDKYKIKWFTILSQFIQVVGLEREMEESLLCLECLPSCSTTKYQVSNTYLPLIVSRRSGFSVTNGVPNVTDVSVIRVFFGNPETWLYKQDVASYWYEIFSNYGGMCGIVGGFSLISFTEIFYFILRQFVLLWLSRSTKFRQSSATLQIYP